MADVLDDIARQTLDDVKRRKISIPESILKDRIRHQRKVISFEKSLNQPQRITVIAELKQASPSAGVIRVEGDLPGRVDGYARGGASALSILTEEHYFRGSPQILEMTRERVSIPILRKDFIVDHYQVEESRALGADAVLLITTLLEQRLGEFITHVEDLGMSAFVELHDERDLDIALQCNARVIGVNNRNLRTLNVNPLNAERLIPQIPKSQGLVVVESGVKEPSQMKEFYQWGARAVLIGETLMRDPDAEKIVRQFVDAGKMSS